MLLRQRASWFETATEGVLGLKIHFKIPMAASSAKHAECWEWLIFQVSQHDRVVSAVPHALCLLRNHGFHGASVGGRLSCTLASAVTGGGGTRRRDKFCPVEALVYGALGAVKGCERTRAAGGCDAHFGLGGDGARRACTAVLHDPGSCSRRPAQGVSHHPCTPSLCRHDEARTQDDGETASVAGTGVVELITKWVRHPNPTVLPPHATRAPLVGAYGAVRRCAGFAWR